MTQTLDRPVAAESEARAAQTRPAHRARRFRPDIEGMRAFAVLAVVLYHAHLGVPGGYVGVDVFFVISGFLITRQLNQSVGRQGIRALPTFYTRRIKRLLPAAAVVVAATVIVARFYTPVLQVRSVAVDALYTTFYGLNYRLAVEGTQYLHQGDAASPLLHFWSLGVEEQFYIFWPVLILVVAWVGGRHRAALLFAALAATAGLSFYYSVTVTETSAPWAYFSLHTRAWELALGALVALGADRLAALPRRLAGGVGWVALLVVVGSAFAFDDATHYPGSLAAVPVVAAAVLIACGCGPRRTSVERVLQEPSLQSIGRVSYSWYLWHWPMLVLIPLIVGHQLNWLGRSAIVWLSLAAAVLTYFLVEDPARHLARRSWQGFGMGVLISGSVVATAAVVLTHLPSDVGNGKAVHVVEAKAATPAAIRQMEQAIAAGVKVRSAPSNLTPSPSRAAHDLPTADGTNCHATFETIRQGACVYGDPHGTHTAVLVGDSHADMWLPAFTRAGLARHWRIVDWTKSSCPVAAITVFNSALNRTYTECDTWRAQVLARIARLRPELVFVSDSENVVNDDVSDARWSDATLKTLRTLRSTTAARVTLLQDVPVPGDDLPSCVAGHLNSVRDCTFATKKAYSFPSRHRQLAGAARRAGFPVVEPRSWICTANRCPAIVGNLLTYRDDTHLTATFSAWLAPRVAPLLTVPQKGR